ncbi:uncharacterized [Tachysurus ichikawai]
MVHELSSLVHYVWSKLAGLQISGGASGLWLNWSLNTDALYSCGGNCAVLCCSLLGRQKHKDTRHLDKLVQKGWLSGWMESGFAGGCGGGMEGILDNMNHVFYNTLTVQRNSRGGRLTSLCCRKTRFRRSFIPTAIRIFNIYCKGRL